MLQPLPGLRVVTASGDVIGSVKQIASDRFEVARTGLPDIWLATGAIAEMRGDLLVLKPHSYELDRWQVGAE